VLAHALFPQIPQGLLPVSVKAVGDLLKRRGFHRVDSLAPLWQSEGGLRFAVRMGQDRHPLPDHTAAAVHQTCIRTCQGGHGLLCLHRYMAGLLEEAPTPGPSLLSPSQACLMLLGFPTRLDLSALGEKRLFAVPPDMRAHMERVGLTSGLRLDRCAGFREAW
jgi:hypothetical protein